jgi:hypothetical protein
LSESFQRGRGHGFVARHQVAESHVPLARPLHPDDDAPDEFVAALWYAGSPLTSGAQPEGEADVVKPGGWLVDGQRGFFDRMFQGVAPFVASDDRLADLAQSMQDFGGIVSDNPTLPSGYTYFGQFIDHDLTLDLTPLSGKVADPKMTRNYRTPRLDLDSLYGDGPEAHRYLYERDRLKFVIGRTAELKAQAKGLGELPNDLPRTSDGIGLIADHRNDENLIVAQLHIAFLKFHNKVVDLVKAKESDPYVVFVESSRLVRWHYQWIVMHDFLKRITAPGVVDHVLATKRLFYTDASYMPLEFSGAAYRLGHSLVRSTYNYNRIFEKAGLLQLFENTGMRGDIKGGGMRALPTSWAIDWRRFFDFGSPDPPVNHARRLGPLLNSSLQALRLDEEKIPNKKSLPYLNLIRGCQVGLPSGQAIAEEMRQQLPSLAVLTPAEISSGYGGQAAAKSGFTKETPLWYYILK